MNRDSGGITTAAALPATIVARPRRRAAITVSRRTRGLRCRRTTRPDVAGHLC
ncbi:MAG: hypothetical protein WKF75_15215 [Singulisphaera sp.]